MRVPLFGTNGSHSGRLSSLYHHSHHALEQDREFRTCLCVHVRTGTLLLGVFQMLAHVVVLLTTMTLILHPNAFKDARQRYHFVDSALNIFPFPDATSGSHDQQSAKATDATQVTDKPLFELPIALSDDPTSNDVDAKSSNGQNSNLFQNLLAVSDHKTDPELSRKAEINKRGERLWTLTLTVLFLFFTFLLVHGVLYRKPSHLLPYFSVQVFDFVLSCLTVMGYMTYMPYLKHHNSEGSSSNANQQSIFPSNNPESPPAPLHYRNWNHVNAGTRLAVMTLAFLMLALKAYFMGMVWACYKYLIMWHRINITSGNVSTPSNVREAWQDMWNQIRRPVLFTWLSATGRQSNRTGGDTESQNLLPPTGAADEAGLYTAERDLEAAEGPTEPPAYDDLLKQPANANMPPPYFKEGAASLGKLKK